jgi:hypothetical protein
MPDSSTNIHEGVPDQTPSEEVSPFDDKRIRLKTWITSKSSFLGDLYEGAVMILYGDPPLPGWRHFTAHAVREIRNRLPDCVAETESISKLDYPQEIKKISSAWTTLGLPITGTVSTEPTTSIEMNTLIPRIIYDSISKMVKDSLEVPDRKYATAYRLFNTLVPEGEFGEKEPIIQEWIDATDWFASSERTHVKSDTQEEVDGYQEYVQSFEMVEHILLGLINSSEDFSQLPKELNEILENTNN